MLREAPVKRCFFRLNIIPSRLLAAAVITAAAACLLLAGCARAVTAADSAVEPSSMEASASSEAVSSQAPGSSRAASSAAAASSQAQTGSGKVICIDPGHQTHADLGQEPLAPGASLTKDKVTGGATGISTGQDEYALNLSVALKAEALLKARGYTVFMTRTVNDVDISNIERAKAANSCCAGLFLRIHADSSDDSSVSGISVLIPGGDYISDKALLSESRDAGGKMLSALVSATGAKNRGLSVRSDMSGFNWCTRPMVLVEMGFLSNTAEDKKLATDSYRNTLAEAMADGADAFFKG